MGCLRWSLGVDNRVLGESGGRDTALLCDPRGRNDDGVGEFDPSCSVQSWDSEHGFHSAVPAQTGCCVGTLRYSFTAGATTRQAAAPWSG